MEPTFRFLRRGEAEPGQCVEYVGDGRPASESPPDPRRVLHPGHPGRVERDYEDGLGGHVVVIWCGLEDTEESSTGVGWNPDENGEYRGEHEGLGWLDAANYESRAARLHDGDAPLAG